MESSCLAPAESQRRQSWQGRWRPDPSGRCDLEAKPRGKKLHGPRFKGRAEGTVAVVGPESNRHRYPIQSSNRGAEYIGMNCRLRVSVLFFSQAANLVLIA
jgi:hypothetical protein